jgi:curved DNA-binding protein
LRTRSNLESDDDQMKFKDYYQTLGIQRDATTGEIKRAYRKLARKYHPDVSDEPDAESRFKEVGEAYEVLKDPEKRAAYDQFGEGWQAGQEFRPPPGGDMGFEYAGTGPGQGEFSDFFESLFGRMGGVSGMGRESTGGFHTRSMRLRGEDHHAKVQVTLQEAFTGTTRTFSLKMPEPKPDGRVRAREHKIRVTIPKGVREGQKIRLSGRGSPGSGGGRSGDLFLEVSLAAHPFFTTDGPDIHLTLPVTPWEVALGATVQSPTLGGDVDLKIPAGSQSGSRLRLKGRGLPGHPAGDQIVTLRIETPAADTEGKRRLYEQMRKQMPVNPREHLKVSQ